MITQSMASRRRFLQRTSTLLAIGVLVAGTPIGALPALADDAIQSQDTNIGGIVAEIVQCKRKEGVLTIKMRLRNTGDKKTGVSITDGGAAYDKYYLTAGDKKYFILRDTENVPLATQDNGAYVNPDIEKGATFTWWAKYPAPPADVKSITFYTGISAPFEDLPITD